MKAQIELPELIEINQKLDYLIKQADERNGKKDRLLRLKEALKYLNVSNSTFYAWRKKGLIKTHRLPNARITFFKESELLELKKAASND